jgi:hypothetical protein
MQLAAGDLRLDRLHDQTLLLDGRETGEGIADDDRLEVTAVTGDVDLGPFEAVADELGYCFSLHNRLLEWWVFILALLSQRAGCNWRDDKAAVSPNGYMSLSNQLSQHIGDSAIN